MPNPRKLLSIGHSYVVRLNRRLINEIAYLGKEEWEVTTIAPTFIDGDLRPITLETDTGEICNLKPLTVYFSKIPHILTYDWQLKEILQQDWDLVHCWIEPYIFSGGQVAWLTKETTPLVYFSAQNKNKRYPPPFNWIENYTMNRASGWIAAGKGVSEALLTRTAYASRPMCVIPHGVDIHHFYPSIDAQNLIRRSLAWSEQDPPVIGFLGRFVPEKGLDLLMGVLDNLKTPWRALFVGSGVMEKKLRTWAKRYPEQVRVCTGIKHNDVPKYLNCMDILVAPSQTVSNWQEQFGRMLIEAFACGVPVIGSDSGEIPYVIQDAGIVVGEKDQQGWLAAISDLLNNPVRRQELANRGLEKAHQVYAWPIIAQQHWKFFHSIL